MENIKWICKCNETFSSRRILQEHHKKCSIFKDKKIKQDAVDHTCNFCKKSWVTTESGFKTHLKFCKFNPNRVKNKMEGTHISEETRQKLKACAGGYRKGAGRGKRGYYKGLYCMSSWELAWVVYQLEHGKVVEQCKEKFKYVMNNETHYYTPDFIMDGIYYEIKNWHRPDTDFKINYFPKDKRLILIEGCLNKPFLDYVIEKYGKNFYDVLYEQKDYTKSKIKKPTQIDILRSKRWELIKGSNIDFSKLGWVSKLSSLFNISENKAGEYIKRNYTDFFENECFKQKRGIYPQSDKLQKG